MFVSCVFCRASTGGLGINKYVATIGPDGSLGCVLRSHPVESGESRLESGVDGCPDQSICM